MGNRPLPLCPSAALPHCPEATIGTVWGDRWFYVANSQWEQYDDAGRFTPGARLEPLRILELRLR